MNAEHILLTGSAGNLGRAVCTVLTQKQYRVSALVSPSHDEDFMVAEGLRVVRADLKNEQLCREVVEGIIRESGPVHAAVLMAGGFSMGSIDDTGMKEINGMIGLNFATAYNMVRPLYRHMEDDCCGGRFIFIGARPVLHPELAGDALAYSLSKSMLLTLASVINAAGTGSGITARVVVPGTIDTPRNRKNMPGADFSQWTPAPEIAGKIEGLLAGTGAGDGETVIEV